jgi:hypothetical protein
MWEQADIQHQIYIDTKAADLLREDAERKHNRSEGFQYVDVYVPYSYAILMSMHTYLCSVFLSRNPVLQYMGRHGEPEQNVQAIEALMDYQTNIGGHLPNYYVWLMDAAKYGLGVLWQYWSKDEIATARFVDKPITVNGIAFEKTEKVREVIRVTGYEGNRTFNVRPADYLPDPRVPLHSPNRGEFQGRRFYMNANTLYKGKASGQYVNVTEALNRAKARTAETNRRRYENRAENLPNPDATSGERVDPTLLNEIPCIEMIIELVPSLWELGKSDFPEKWVFVLADEEVVIEAHPYGMLHGKFPGETIEIETDGYNLGSRGVYEVAQPLNDTINWLFNSHFYNVRKSLNGDIIYDPSRISTKDIRDGAPGKRIRVKPEAYGEDIRRFMHIIPPDSAVTQTHLRDIQVVADIMHKVTGVSEAILGQQSSGGRKSATEVRTSSSSSVNRMKTAAEYIGVLGFSPFAGMLLQSTQQNYQAEKKFRLAGDLIESSEQFVTVTPELIAGEYDYTPVDGTLPVDRFAIVQMWTNFFTQLRNFPQVAQEYDMGKIFAHVAQLGGLKSVKQFRVNVGQPGQQPGMIPMEEFIGGERRGGPRGQPIKQGRGTANGAGDTPRLTVPT